MRTFYRCLLAFHPPAFRRQFASEMLWIFDQAAAPWTLVLDGAASLARQWLIRSDWWKVAAAIALAMLQVGSLVFTRRPVAKFAAAVSRVQPLEFHGPLAQQPLTTAIVVYLAVLVLGGLFFLLLGLTYWVRAFSLRRAR